MNTIWELLFIAGIVVVAALVVIGVMAPHTVQQYYVGRPLSSNTSGYCVMKSIEWDMDEAAFCSDDINKVIEVNAKLNEQLHKK